MTNQEYANGLRAAADWYELHPEVKIPQSQVENCLVKDKDDAVLVVKALGNCDKNYSAALLTIMKEITPGFFLKFVFWRNAVCERVVTGKTTIAAHTKQIPEEVIEEVEWRCAPILAAGKEVAA
jgi:hypothetical protein